MVFLVNGQRHDTLDESFVARNLGFKCLRSRTMVIVDADKLAPKPSLSSCRRFAPGLLQRRCILGNTSEKVISVLKGDPDLKRLESDAEQEVAELKSGDEAVKSKLDQLIDGHHSAGAEENALSGGFRGTDRG